MCAGVPIRAMVCGIQIISSTSLPSAKILVTPAPHGTLSSFVGGLTADGTFHSNLLHRLYGWSFREARKPPRHLYPTLEGVVHEPNWDGEEDFE
jgi:hypothetical protein